MIIRMIKAGGCYHLLGQTDEGKVYHFRFGTEEAAREAIERILSPYHKRIRVEEV